MKLIDLHKRWCKSGRLPMIGLCYTIDRFGEKEDLDYLLMFKPDKIINSFRGRYWGYGKFGGGVDNVVCEYTPLRQTIVLLICCMKNEI